MPNGTPDFHQTTEPEYDRFFEPIAIAVSTFAERHNLKLEKYYNEAPVWSLLFRHPRGGVAKIDIEKDGEDHCKLRKSWWRDDYDKGVRSIRQAQVPEFRRDSARVALLLNDALHDILSWPSESWTGQHGGFADIWQRTWSRDAFNQLEHAYPVPIP